jgi:hypothetical protein
VDDGNALYSLSVLVARSRQPIPGFRTYHDSTWREHSKLIVEGVPFERDQPGTHPAWEPGKSAQGG